MGPRPATLKEIARRLNISVSSASRALHDHASIGLRTKMRVQQLAKELNYEPNQNAILFKKGKTSMIGVINGPEKLMASDERREGYILPLKKHRIKPDPNYMVSSDLTPESTCNAMQQLLDLKKRPTAIIAFNDYVAMDAIRYAKKKKIRVNREISFVSFANQPICGYMDNPPLASVEQFPYQQGQKATEILLQLLQRTDKCQPDPEFHHILLQPKLVLREAL